MIRTSGQPWAAGLLLAFALAAGVRTWNALTGPLLFGYDAWGHVAYVLYLDLYRALPHADQGWSYYQPPLHYAIGALLARLGSAEALARGLALLASAASLGTALLAARVARVAHPAQPALALLAFSAVAFLPVHFTLSEMPGNELTVAFLNSAAIAVFVLGEQRGRASWRRDAATGALIGLAALAKHHGLLSGAAVAASLAGLALLEAPRAAALRRAALRGLRIAAVALLVAGPYYAWSVRDTGKLIPSNRDYPLVSGVEAGQPPGARGWRDYVQLPPALLRDPNPLAPHMLRSVWGSLYASTWVDVHREADAGRALELERGVPRGYRAMLWLGLLPTVLALAGAALAGRDVLRGRRRSVYVPLGVLAAGMGVAFAGFAWIVPRWSALKAGYCLSLSLPFALFLCRGVLGVWRRAPRSGRAALAAALAGVALASCAMAAVGLVLPRRRDAPASGALHYYYGEYAAARRVYTRLVDETRYDAPWLESLAAVEIAQGRPDRARALLERAAALAQARGLRDPERDGRLAVAAALAGDLDGARATLDASIAEQPAAERLANRGVLRAVQGDAAGARADLEAALALEPDLVTAWLALARVEQARGATAAATAARVQAVRAACRAPRRYPYGIGTGEVLEWGVGRRPLLLWDGDALRVALPAFFRGACAALAERRP